MKQIKFEGIVFQEEKNYVAYCPELDVSSCGKTIEQSRENLKTAVRLFLEEAEKMGTLEMILTEAGYRKNEIGWLPPKIVSTKLMSVGLAT